MRKLLLIVALAALAGPATAQEVSALHTLPGGYAAPIGPDAAYPDDMNILADCPDTLGLRYAQNMAAGSICGGAVFEWLLDTNRLPLPVDHEFVRVSVQCGARLILADGDPQKTAAQILAAEFDKNCGEDAIM